MGIKLGRDGDGHYPRSSALVSDAYLQGSSAKRRKWNQFVLEWGHCTPK